MTDDSPDITPGRPSGLPYPIAPPTGRDELPDRGEAGAPASWGLRAAARLMDFLLFSLLFGWITAALGTEVVETSSNELVVKGPKWTFLLFPVFFLAYETVCISNWGQTLGKWVCQVKVVNWYDGSLPTMRQAAIRAFVPGVFLLIAGFATMLDLPWLGYLQLVAVIIYLASLADVVYRGPHDKAAATIVLAAPRRRA